MAVRAVAENAAAGGAAAEGSVAKGAAAKVTATEGAASEGAAAEVAAAEGAASESAAAAVAAESATAPMQTPAEQAPVTEQLTASTQPVPDSMQLLTTYATVHRACEQHWSTVSEHEEGVHNQFSERDRSTASWGAKRYCRSPGVHNWQLGLLVFHQL